MLLNETRTCRIIPPGGLLYPGESIRSSNGAYILKFQTDGNVVLYKNLSSSPKPIWDTGTSGHPTAAKFIMQSDGNLVLYDTGDIALWAATQHGGHLGDNAGLHIQDDGNLVVYGLSDPSVLWASNTNEGSQLNP